MTTRLFITLFLFSIGGLQIVGERRQAVGSIQGTVTREGTSDPIPDVQITVNGGNSGSTVFFEMLGPNAAPQQIRNLAQSVIDAAERGTTVPAELLAAAQDALQEAATGPATPSAPLTAVTDAAGHFRIENVPVGNTVLRAHLKGYFAPAVLGEHSPSVQHKAVVEERKVSDVQIKMVQGGTISGRIYSAAGKAMTGVSIQLLRPGYGNGQFSPQPIDTKMTDDRGEYRFYQVPPGEYYVAVSPARSLPNLASVSPAEIPIATLYPDSTDVQSAEPVALRAGEERTDTSIRVRTAPAAKISGKVVSSLPPGPVAGQRGQTRPSTPAITFMRHDAIGLDELNGGGAIVLNAPAGATARADDGSFEISNIPPGTYDVFARLPVAPYTGWGTANPPARATGPWAIGRAAVSVNAAGVEGVTIVIGPGVDLKGRVIVDGKPVAGDIRVSLEPDEYAANINDGQMVQIYGQIAAFEPPIGADGSFTIPLIPEGPYRIRTIFGPSSRQARGQAGASTAPPATPLPESAYVADIRQDGVSVYDSGILIGRGEPNPVEVVVNTNGGSIEGTVMGRDEQPASGMFVVLVPELERRSNPGFYKSVTSDASGHFKISRVPPGSYTLIASPGVQAAALQNAKVFEKYGRFGAAVRVSSGPATSILLKVIPLE